MTSYEQQKKLRRFLAKLLVCLLIFGNVALAPVSGASATMKTPVLSVTSQNLLLGGITQLKVENKEEKATYLWKSEDPNIASVDNTGTVKGMAKGNTTITCTMKTAEKTYQLKCAVTVRIPAKGIVITNKVAKLKVGETVNLNRTLIPKNSNDKTIWRSSDTTIAKVFSNGKVRALKEGSVTITASTLSGKKASVKIKIVTAKTEKTVTAKDLKDGVVKLSNATYDILTIDSSIGTGEVILENVKVKEALYMEADAAYTVRAIQSDINKVVALEATAQIASLAVDQKNTAPTFVAEKGTLVVTVDARGNVSVKQDGEAKIGTVTVNRSIDGNISLSLEGFEGNLIVNTTSNADIAITTKNCDIEETTISGSASGQKLTLTDDTTNGAVSSLGKINVETSAKLNIDVPAKEVIISEKATNALVTLEKPVDKVVNEGTATKLTVNSNVGNIESAGKELNMKVAAGSTIKKVELTGSASSVDIALGSKIEAVIAKGDNTAISGSGSVVSATIEGNNAKITTADTKVSVGANASGTQVNGSQVSAGTTTTTAPAAPTNGGSTGGNTGGTTGGTNTPSTGTKLTISNPGDVFCGQQVTMRADSTDVIWSVYGYINDTYGEADIDANTGVLTANAEGIVRVVATSKNNSNVYGAVDLPIQGKKFVRMEAVSDIVLNTDESIADVSELEVSGKLPTIVNLVYETGVGNATETIPVALTPDYWFGQYQGAQTGTYVVGRSIQVPTGYEHPSDFYCYVKIRVNTPQTDDRLIITSVAALPAITLSTDEKLMKIGDLYGKYLNELKPVATLSDGTTRELEVSGWYTDSGNQYNGAVPGSYIVNLSSEVPSGLNGREIYQFDENRVYWNKNNSSLAIPVTIVVSTPQTSNGYTDNNAPAATQTKFSVTKTPAVIDTVSLAGVPTSVFGGDVIELSNYLTVTTASSLASDQRVTWTVNGYSSFDILNPLTGVLNVNRKGTLRIRATSVTDTTKYAEAMISVSSGAITFGDFSNLTVSEDKGIVSFRTLYKKLQTQLPNSVAATAVSGGSIVATGGAITLGIDGWEVGTRSVDSSNGTGTYELRPIINIYYTYDSGTIPILTVTIAAAQTDNRIVVDSVSPVTGTLTLAEDQYATSEYYLAKNYNYTKGNITLNATLTGGSTVQLSCPVTGYDIRCANPLDRYRGLPGTYTLRLTVSLPEEYKSMTGSSFTVEQTLVITKEQSPRYEELWVSTNPSKMTYQAGQMLDLSGIMVMLKDTAALEDDTYTYISAAQLASYGIEVYTYEGGSGKVNLLTNPLTKDMDGGYVELHSTYNDSYTFFGKITVTD